MLAGTSYMTNQNESRIATGELRTSLTSMGLIYEADGYKKGIRSTHEGGRSDERV